MLRLKLSRFKVFLRGSCVKKIYFCEKLICLKDKIEEFKTALLEQKSYEELFEEEQQKMLTGDKNQDLIGFFHKTLCDYWI